MQRSTSEALTLIRRDADQNMHSYYRLHVQPNLFRVWCVIREWSRIGRAGQARFVPSPTPTETEAELDRQLRAKEHRSYG